MLSSIRRRRRRLLFVRRCGKHRTDGRFRIQPRLRRNTPHLAPTTGSHSRRFLHHHLDEQGMRFRRQRQPCPQKILPPPPRVVFSHTPFRSLSLSLSLSLSFIRVRGVFRFQNSQATVVQQQLRNLQNHHNYMKVREIEHRHVTEQTFTDIMFWTILEGSMVCLLVRFPVLVVFSC